MPAPSIRRATLAAATAFPPSTHGRILDLSCGDGDLAGDLLRLGYRPEGTHFREDDYIFRQRHPDLEKIPLYPDVDLSKPLPFQDGEFDGVIATEVLEHLPHHPLIFAEIGRILRPGGFLFFSTPNIHRIDSRLGFALHGMHELAGATLNWSTTPSDLYSTHYNPVYFPVAHTLLHQAGLHVQALAPTRGHPLAYLLFPLGWTINALALTRAVRKHRRPHAGGGRDLFRWMAHPRMLLDRHVFVVAQKTTDAPDA